MVIRQSLFTISVHNRGSSILLHTNAPDQVSPNTLDSLMRKWLRGTPPNRGVRITEFFHEVNAAVSIITHLHVHRGATNEACFYEECYQRESKLWREFLNLINIIFFSFYMPSYSYSLYSQGIFI